MFLTWMNDLTAEVDFSQTSSEIRWTATRHFIREGWVVRKKKKEVGRFWGRLMPPGLTPPSPLRWALLSPWGIGNFPLPPTDENTVYSRYSWTQTLHAPPGSKEEESGLKSITDVGHPVTSNNLIGQSSTWSSVPFSWTRHLRNACQGISLHLCVTLTKHLF